ncbi:MAG TPA: GAF and ANTAR domain-containing protein [Verrucomicrobiae bacterium]|nr:GAF and ANTAR domain-containing protein [Verrucomicrobiae bacterium]
MNLHSSSGEDRDIRFLHELGERIAAADPLHTVLALAVDFVSAVVKCDSCFIYVVEGSELILRASKNPHSDVVDRLRLRLGQGITGWVAEHRKPVAIAREAMLDPRFQVFNELPEDRYEAFLSAPMLCRDKAVGVINVQHRKPHAHSEREIHLVSTIGFLVGPEIEAARIEAENARLAELPEARKMVEKANAVLRRDLGLDEEQAAAALRHHSRQTRKSLKEIAEAIVLCDDIRRAHGRARTW